MQWVQLSANHFQNNMNDIDIRSNTKTVVALYYGVAHCMVQIIGKNISNDIILQVHEPLLKQFYDLIIPNDIHKCMETF